MFKRALKQSIPVFFAYFSLGIVYGLLFVGQGYPWYFPPLFSVFVFGGSMQFVALTLFGGSVFGLVAVMLPLALRHCFYGLSMVERFRCHPLLRLYLAFGLVDATYCILMSKPKEEKDIKYITWLTLLIHLYWIAGTLLGAVFGSAVLLPEGLSFALTAFFVVMALDKVKSVRPVLISGVALALALWLAPQHFLLVAFCGAVAGCLLFPEEQRRLA